MGILTEFHSEVVSQEEYSCPRQAWEDDGEEEGGEDTFLGVGPSLHLHQVGTFKALTSLILPAAGRTRLLVYIATKNNKYNLIFLLFLSQSVSLFQGARDNQRTASCQITSVNMELTYGTGGLILCFSSHVFPSYSSRGPNDETNKGSRKPLKNCSRLWILESHFEYLCFGRIWTEILIDTNLILVLSLNALSNLDVFHRLDCWKISWPLTAIDLFVHSLRLKLIDS